MILPFQTNVLRKVIRWYTDSSNMQDNPLDTEVVTSLDEADVVTSQTKYGSRLLHTLVLDIDVPAALVPSSTPGHSHLYIDVLMTWNEYKTVLKALADAGIVERGYVSASKSRGFTAVRLPWVKRQTERKRKLPLIDRTLDAFPYEGSDG